MKRCAAPRRPCSRSSSSRKLASIRCSDCENGRKGCSSIKPLGWSWRPKSFLPHEDLLFIQRGQFDASEKARLAQRVAAAETWTLNQAPQVLIEGLPAVEVSRHFDAASHLYL